jgi:hypothetical protein
VGYDLGIISDGTSQGSSGTIFIVDLANGHLIGEVCNPYIDDAEPTDDFLRAKLGPASAEGGEGGLATSLSFSNDGDALIATLLTSGSLFIQIHPELRVAALPVEPFNEDEHQFRGAAFVFSQGNGSFFTFCPSLTSSGSSAEQLPYAQFWQLGKDAGEDCVLEVFLPLQDEDRLRHVVPGIAEGSVMIAHDSGAIIQYAPQFYSPQAHPQQTTNPLPLPRIVVQFGDSSPEDAKAGTADWLAKFLDVNEGFGTIHLSDPYGKLMTTLSLDTIWCAEIAAVDPAKELIAIAGSAGKYSQGAFEVFRIADGHRAANSVRCTYRQKMQLVFSRGSQLLSLAEPLDSDPSSYFNYVYDVASGKRLPFASATNFHRGVEEAGRNSPTAAMLAEVISGSRRTSGGVLRLSWSERARALQAINHILKPSKETPPH